MTTFDDGNPTMSQFLFWKLGKVLAKRNRAKEGTSSSTWLQSTIRLISHLAGLGCLTLAGFTVNITAGLIVAGVSFFILSWLNTSANRPQENQDPTGRR